MHTHRDQHLDFGAKNFALVAVVAITLGFLAWEQKPIRFSHDPQPLQQYADAALFNNANTNSSGTEYANGAVLGATVFNPTLLAKLSNIDIRTTDNNSAVAAQNYTQQVGIVLSNDHAQELVASNSQSDEAINAQAKLLSDLKNIVVPSQLAEFHKLLVGYYGYSFMSQAQPDDQNITAMLMQITQELRVIKDSLGASGISLPS